MLNNFKKIFNENKYKLLLELFAVAFGVFLAVQVESCRKEAELNEITMTKLNLFGVEFDFNISRVEYVMKCYSRDITSDSLELSILDDFCTRDLLEDDNIHNILVPEVIYLIKDYMNQIRELNFMNDLFIKNYTKTSDITLHDFDNFIVSRKFIVSKCKVILSIGLVIVQELIDVRKDNYAKGEKLKNFRKRIEERYEMYDRK